MEKLEKEILDKKLSYYDSDKNDFKAINELTVEITLGEYRKLIQHLATKKYDIEKAEKDKYTREKQNEELKNRVKGLENIIFEYKKLYGELPIEKDDESEEK